MKKIITYSVTVKTWWNRGLSYVTIPITIFNLVSLSLLWRPILVTYGIPSWVFYVIVPTVMVSTTLFLGKYDVSHNIYLEECDVNNKMANPYDKPFNKMFLEVTEINERLKKME
jgi:hypothetical protein